MINYMIICKEISELQHEGDVLIVKFAVKVIELFNKKEKYFSSIFGSNFPGSKFGAGDIFDPFPNLKPWLFPFYKRGN